MHTTTIAHSRHRKRVKFIGVATRDYTCCTHNHDHEAGSSTHCANCHSSSRSSDNCSHSSNCSSPLVSQAHECQSCSKGDALGLESLGYEPSGTKLLVARRPLCHTADDTSFFNSQEAIPSSLVPCPSTSTGPSPVEGRGTKDRWRAMRQKDIEAMSHATCVPNFRGQRSGSMPKRGQAQTQGCQVEGQGACSDTLVVPAARLDRPPFSVPSVPVRNSALAGGPAGDKKVRVDRKAEAEKDPASMRVGFRRIRAVTCHERTEVALPTFCREVEGEGGLKQELPRGLVNSGPAFDLSVARLPHAR